MPADTPSRIEAPRVLTTQPERLACIDLVVPRERIREVMGPGIGEVYAAVTAQGLKPSGPWFTWHRRRPAETFDFAICVPVAAAVKPAGRVRPGELPAATVARTVYRGPYEGLAEAWGEFHRWIVANGHAPRSELWERYLQGPESGPDPAQWCTELNQPLAERIP